MSTVSSEVKKIAAWAIGIIAASVVTAIAAFVLFNGRMVWSNNIEISNLKNTDQVHTTQLLDIQQQLKCKASEDQARVLERKLDTIQATNIRIISDLAAIKGSLGLYYFTHGKRN